MPMSLLNKQWVFSANDLRVLIGTQDFYARNTKKNGEMRTYHCDFKPRKKYKYNGKWRWIRNKNALSTYEKTQFLNVYDRDKQEFRRINMNSLYYLRIKKHSYLVRQVKDVETFPRVALERLP
tara:strand:+ start:237 stop:605 length:369 start_codon:yes stop_codon:yes gene_type:complete